MRTLTTFLLLFIVVTASFGQIKYVKGYFINNDNKKVECLIKNKDWKNNPAAFSYKLEDVSKPEEGNITSVKEFGIYNDAKFVRSDVKIDRSSSLTSGLSDDPNPFWRKEKLFLRVLLEGKANLYSYDSSNGKKFFYSVTDTSIMQLIYKRYKFEAITVENDSYRDQLLTLGGCTDSELQNVDNVTYTADDLEGYFTSYNRCMGDTILEIKNMPKRNHFNLKITPGINSSSMEMVLTETSFYTPFYTFKPSLSFRIGLEFESILPFNNNKWGLVFEPAFQSFNARSEDNNLSNWTTKFKSIEFPVGVRYYFYLNDQAKFYVNGFFIPNWTVDFDSRIALNEFVYFDIIPTHSLAFGGGFEHNRFSVESRYYTDRNMMNNQHYRADYSRLSLILGYKLLQSKR